MAIETKIEEVKEVVMKRVPPGDRWSPIGSPSTILDSLTDALEYHFQSTGQTQFFLDARKGTVEVIHTEEVKVEKPIKKYSLYEEY
ncbi:MAG: hypothetical protein RLZZ196_509 [Bacteroidota bacterium]|jgi:hypothetical protein